MALKPEYLIRRFWSKVDRSGGPDACWLWQAGLLDGYGRFWDADAYNDVYAHRFAWIITHGAIPEDLRVLHSCDVRPCVNPSHLWLGTQLDNLTDMVIKGRSNVGDKHWMHKISEAELEVVQENMRATQKISLKRFAR